MHEFKINVIAALLLVLLGVVIIPVAAFAASTPVQEIDSISAGSCTVTQEADYVVFQLTKLEYTGLQPANATLTVVRASSGITNTVGTLIVTSGAGVISNLSEYVFRNDKLVTTGAGTNAGIQRRTGSLLP